ncbi:MAG: hypothetical protein SFY96_06365 [Planctomycetota bacterium]|nr:hypothetical protein [Planctomycetota bacterium]
MSHEAFDRLISDYFPLIAIGGFVFGIVLIRTIAGIFKTSARERTRREIAAFIAEGSMTPEQGERLLNAGRHDR